MAVERKNRNYRALIRKEIEDIVTLADSSYWIPFTSTTTSTEWEVEKLEYQHNDYSTFSFNAIPTIFSLRMAFIRVLVESDVVDSIRFILALTSKLNSARRKNSLTRALREVKSFYEILSQEELWGEHWPYASDQQSTVINLQVIQDVLAAELVNIRLPAVRVPRWKGKVMEFIEFISIGIELGMFEGENQNQICNALIKAFDVDAENEAPIYKQRVDAMFRRTKTQLPLISAYVKLMESRKRMEVR